MNLFVDSSNTFENLYFGVRHMSLTPQYTMTLDQNIFTNCSKALFVVATENMTITRNTIEVKETGAGYDYGSYMYNCGGFEFEDNTFSGTGSNTPKVGSIFQDCGPANNEFYKNNYNGFVGDTALNFSAGTIISGQNQHPDSANIGLTFKCNNYSNAASNDHDIAFTDVDVSVGSQQGFMFDQTTPAGNSFANNADCGITPGKHFYVEDDSVSTFEYWHHTPEPTIELVPRCADSPIDTTTWLVNTSFDYDPDPISGSCPTMLNQFQPDSEHENEILAAEAQLAILWDVYNNWEDGGDTEGLIEFIQTPANNSYSVRNEMMLVAPKVGDDAWTAAFERQPPMNPWHLAQALIANSPLSATVMRMMDRYSLNPYFKQLVKGAQNGGISMNSIYQSEIAHFERQKTTALRDLTAKAMRSGDPEQLGNARTWHEEHPTHSSPQIVLGLSLALDDLTKAREIVDVQLTRSKTPEYWEVQELYLSLLEEGQGSMDLDADGIAVLNSIATSDLYGAGHAQAWLYLFGQIFEENVVLPFHGPKRLNSDEPSRINTSFINVMPNPSRGPVAIAVQLPEGAESGEIRVVDPLGRTVLERSFSGRVQLLELDTKGFANGIFIAELSADGIPLGHTKFEIIK